MVLSLRRKIQLGILGLVTCLGISALGAFYYVYQADLERQVKNDADRAIDSVENYVLKKKAGLLAEAKLIADLLIMQSVMLTRHRETIQDRAAFYGKFLGVDALVVTNSDGELIGEYGDVPTQKLLNESASVLQGETWSGCTVEGGSLYLTVAVPVITGGYVKGSLIFLQRIGAEEANDLSKTLGLSIAFSSNRKLLATFPTDLPERIISSPNGRQVNWSKYEFIPMHRALSNALGPDDITLSVLSDATEYSSQFRQVFRLFGGIYLATIFALMALSGRLAASLARPLERVADAARKLQKGEWPERLQVDRNDEVGLLQTAFNEMTDAIQASRERIISMADLDPLTEANNHRRTKEILSRECAEHQELSLLLLDVDRFTEFNHKHGPQAGDNLLRLLAFEIRATAPEGSYIGRFGGEEFVLILPDTSSEVALKVAQDILNTAKQVTAIEFGEPVTLSAGIAEFGASADDADGLLLAAELAASRAKQLGRDQASFFEPLEEGLELGNSTQLKAYLRDSSFATIQALAAAVDAKDSYTQGHSQRVAEYALDLARHIGTEEQLCQLIFRAGTLHDVGKIGVPDNVLKKPGRLTDEERALMQTHPVLGEVIVRKVPQLTETLPGVLHHHEAWNGTGYPAGLKGEDIPWIARVLAIADTFDAMTSDRPYRKGMPVDVALCEIERNAGIQFDPDLAIAFVEMMRRRHQIAA